MSGFREVKQEIGSDQRHTRNPVTATNHLQSNKASTTLTSFLGTHRLMAPARPYATCEPTEYPFGELHRILARDLADQGFGIECPNPDKPKGNL